MNIFLIYYVYVFYVYYAENLIVNNIKLEIIYNGFYPKEVWICLVNI